MILQPNRFTGQKARAYLSQRRVRVVEYEMFPEHHLARIKTAQAIAEEPLFLALVKNIVRSRQEYSEDLVLLPEATDDLSLLRLKTLLNELSTYDIIPSYKIDERNKIVVFRRPLSSEQLNFLTGIWLEYYVGHIMIETLKRVADSGIECDFLFRAKYGKREQVRGEIDCLALVDTTVIIVEAKSCRVSDRIDKSCISKQTALATRVDGCAVVVSLAAEQVERRDRVAIVPCKKFIGYFDEIVQKKGI